MSLTEIAERQHALEESLAQAVAEIVAMGTDLTATLAEGSHNVVTLTKQREGAAIEVQVIVKCGTAHEVRDDLWDAIINRQDMVTVMIEGLRRIDDALKAAGVKP